jgi:hypothetical protein
MVDEQNEVRKWLGGFGLKEKQNPVKEYVTAQNAAQNPANPGILIAVRG